MLIDPQELPYQTGLKVKPMRCKPLNLVITDPSARAAILLQTLEGEQEIKANPKGVMFCMGEDDDVWQQDTEKVFANYTIGWVDEDGWMTCEPRSDAPRDVYQIPEDVESFEIPARWGQSLAKLDREPIEGPGETYEHVQFGTGGDWVMRMPEDHGDVYICRKKVFKNTYEVQPVETPA